MIHFGRTHVQKKADQQAKIKRKGSGVRKFALFPAQLQDGTWIWLKHYYRFYEVSKDCNGDFRMVYDRYNSKQYANHLHNDIAHVVVKVRVGGGTAPLNPYEGIKELL